LNSGGFLNFQGKYSAYPEFEQEIRGRPQTVVRVPVCVNLSTFPVTLDGGGVFIEI